MRRCLQLLVALTVPLVPLSACTGAPPSSSAAAATWREASTGTSATPKPPPRDAHWMVYDVAARSVVVFGGKGTRDRYFNDLWAYHVSASGWTKLTTTGPVPAARFGEGMAYDSQRGEIVVFGGVSLPGSTPQISADTWAYGSRTGRWTRSGQASGHPAARLYPSMAYDPVTRTIVLFGGWNGSDALGDTWSYDTRTGGWTRVSTVAAPRARWGASMAYDPATGEMILYGGLFGSYDGTNRLNDTWAYDPARKAWTDLRPAGQVPSARAYAATAYDQSAGKLVIFGGFAGPRGLLGDTWTYDPVMNRWAKLDPGTQDPARRDFSSMAYDPATKEIVLFGGQTGTSGNVNATDLADMWLLHID